LVLFYKERANANTMKSILDNSKILQNLITATDAHIPKESTTMSS